MKKINQDVYYAASSFIAHTHARTELEAGT